MLVFCTDCKINVQLRIYNILKAEMQISAVLQLIYFAKWHQNIFNWTVCLFEVYLSKEQKSFLEVSPNLFVNITGRACK